MKRKMMLNGQEIEVGGGANLQTDPTLTKDGDTLSVTTPVQGILSQAEFDALPEAERNRGLYVVDDGASATTIAIDGKAAKLPSGGTAQEIYSTEETRIGTWIDGKPIYRRSFKVVSPSVAGTSSSEVLHIEIPVETMVDLYGSVLTKSSQFCPLPYYVSSTDNIYIAYNPPTHAMYPSSLRVSCGSSNTNTPLVVTLEYTKTTDAAPTAAKTEAESAETFVYNTTDSYPSVAATCNPYNEEV